MEEIPRTILVLGGLLLLGLAADGLARRTPLPRVTLLLLLGAAAGPAGLAVLPTEGTAWFRVVTDLALVMIGFLLGGEFTRRHVREIRGTVFALAAVQSLATAAAVIGGLLALGVDPRLALPLGGIAVATAPAATLAVIRDSGAEGRFTDVLKGIVAVDDVIGVLVFSLLLALTGLAAGPGPETGSLLFALREIGGAVAVGLALGLPAAALTGRLQSGEATLEEALALILLCTGLAMALEVSPILSAMVMGATVANLATHHERPFHEIESVEWPFLVVFFLLAGASLDLGALRTTGTAAVGYVVFRTVGKVAGPLLGARLLTRDRAAAPWLGVALLPQAGVALGLALAAALRFPSTGPTLLNVVVASTVVFELVGPVFTRLALRRADAGGAGSG